jgi:NADPH-dependent ferric siderophore reductase
MVRLIRPVLQSATVVRGPVNGCPTFRLTVHRLQRISQRITRMVAGGPGLSAYRANGCTDAHVRILFPRAGIAYPEDFDMRWILARMPREHWPRTRTYTVRHFDRVAGELAIDFFAHGRTGLARSWLATLAPGDEVLMQGPGGRYRPNERADWYLFVGDQVSLPAIAAALEVLEAGARARLVLDVTDAADEQRLASRADLDVTWLYRAKGDDVIRTVERMMFRKGAVDAFVRGEARTIYLLRRHLVHERGLRREQLSISGYWRLGMNDEAWRAWKAPIRRARPRRRCSGCAATWQSASPIQAGLVIGGG